MISIMKTCCYFPTVLFCALSVAVATAAPTETPNVFVEGDPISVSVSGLTSTRHIVKYQWLPLPWWKGPHPESDEQQHKSLLDHPAALDTQFKLRVNNNVTCHKLKDRSTPITLEEVALLVRLIEERYRLHFSLDGLSIGEEGSDSDGTWPLRMGFPLGLPTFTSKTDIRSKMNQQQEAAAANGFADGSKLPIYELDVDDDRDIDTSAISHLRRDPDQVYINNHLAFFITLNEVPREVGHHGPRQYHITGFKVSPMSVGYTDTGHKHVCAADDAFIIPDALQPLAIGGPTQKRVVTNAKVDFTYSVVWKVNPNIPWENRWNVYVEAHKFKSASIIHALTTGVAMSAIFGTLMLRLLKSEKPAAVSLQENLEKGAAVKPPPSASKRDPRDNNWKLIADDVFQTPQNSSLLSLFIGTGVQLIFTAGSALSLTAAGGFFVHHSAPRIQMIVTMVYIATGFINGYVTAQLLKYFKSRSWRLIFTAAVFFPGQIFLGYLLLNFVHWGKGSTSAAPFTSILMLIALWACVSLPLVLIGGIIGFRTTDVFTAPRKVSSIPRTIPPQPWYLRRPVAFLIAGFIPFGTAFIELIFVLTSVWQGRVYYFFGFFSVIFVMVLLTAAEATIMLVYLQLVHLDYRWWWSSFMAAGYYGVWLFMYSVLYYFLALDVSGWWSTVLYFAYMSMASYFCFVLVGTCGFLATFVFVRVIYSSIKVD